MRKIYCLTLLISGLVNAPAATFTVVNTNVAGPGSLSNAIVQANATPGQDLIDFNIPETGARTISVPTALPQITDSVVIDAYTQPGANPNTLANGDNAVLLIELDGNNGEFNGLHFTSGATNSTVRGLVLNRFGGFGAILLLTSSNVVEGCFIGTDPTGTIPRGNGGGVRTGNALGNKIGGATPAARNIVSGNRGPGIQMDVNSIGTVVQGNFIGTDATGTNVVANSGDGILINNGSHNCVIGGASSAARNIIAGNGNSVGISVANSSGHIIQGNFIGTDVSGAKQMSFGTVIGTLNASSCSIGGLASTPGTPPGNVIAGGVNGAIVIQNANGHVIQGNLIGTDASGTLDFGSANRGITLAGADNCTIGGTNAGAANVISGHALEGVLISTANANTLQGNLIGTDVTGVSPLPNAGGGISFEGGVRNSLIGPGNIIAFNGDDGVRISVGSDINNQITANSIFANGSSGNHLGIDLGVNGPTANDPGDADVGPNQLQNFPVLTNVIVSLAGVTFQGFLASAPNTVYRLEFFANAACNSSGFGQGQTYLGSTNVTTDTTGTNFFSVTVPAEVPCHFFATATATDPDRNTSEFSALRPSAGVDADGDGACDVDELLAGTNPDNPASVFRIINIMIEGGDVRVTWLGGGGTTNMLQTTTRLLGEICTNNFTDLPPALELPGSGDVFTNHVHIGGATNRVRYYRVRLVR